MSELPLQNNGSIPLNDPAKTGEDRNPDGTFKPGFSGNPKGMKPGTVSITAEIKKILGDIYIDPRLPLAEKRTALQLIVSKILKNAIEKEDQKALDKIWAYIDGLPKGSLDLGVDREGLAELTEFMKILANPNRHNGGNTQ